MRGRALPGSKPRPSSATSMAIRPSSAARGDGDARGLGVPRPRSRSPPARSRKATVRWVSESASAAARSSDTRAPRHSSRCTSARVAAANPSSSSAIGWRSKIARRRALTESRADAAARATPSAAPGRAGAQLGAQRVEREPEPDQLLDGPVVQVLGDAAALLLLGEHDRGRQRPAARRWRGRPRRGARACASSSVPSSLSLTFQLLRSTQCSLVALSGSATGGCRWRRPGCGARRRAWPGCASRGS